ncbi:hypothetical protein PAXINDRAFT_17449 [Paxillus involutus ATCC 200175]|uniref:DUF6532 domain-containing protein n=1 Tax=Paxillus involutus ATCC 200175 TaxID=664439 RepID=A0A0C9TET0_PAXIN|nr:hypothetical protein PAXINDRAFT_17449 [Paxillus involutus ATCC 200175]
MFATNVDHDRSPAINEASPSNDDCFTESVLYGQGFPASEQQNSDAHTRNDVTRHTGQPEVERVQSIPTQSQHNHIPGLTTTQNKLIIGDVEDIVAHHRWRNHAPCLPDNAQLLTIQSQQNSQGSCSTSRINSTMDDLDDLETPILALIQSPAQQSTSATDVDPPSMAHPVVAVASGTSGMIPDNNDPSQLQFYAPSIHDIIEHAKQFSHCDITSANSFPLHPDFNNKAVEYMNEAIAECHSRGLLIPNGWWPQHMLDITRLISLWEDIRNWWSSLKKKAHSHVHECYEWDPQNCHTVNADIVKKLLDRGFFLKHGMDKEGHMNNLTHPSLSSLIIDFFYTGSNSMGNLFPKIFKNEVPCATVALATTAIKLALDEMAAKGKEVTFK